MALKLVSETLEGNSFVPELHVTRSQLLESMGNIPAAAEAAISGLDACGSVLPLLQQRDAMMGSLIGRRALVNVAIGKAARQSSFSRWSRSNDPQGAVNGVRWTDYGFHTENESQPWWQLDLGAVEEVRRIVIYNRDRMCQEHADRLIVESSIDCTDWVVLAHDPGRFTGASGKQPLTLWYMRPWPIRYLRLRLPDHKPLHLQQVEVFAEQDIGAAENRFGTIAGTGLR